MNIPQQLLYTKQHEWISVEDEVGTIGITDHAQKELGDVVFVDLPEPGTRVQAEDAFGSVESVKAVSEVFSPVSGRVIEVNSDLTENPETLNKDPYGKGWMVKVKIADMDLLDALMSPEDYVKYLQEESGE